MEKLVSRLEKLISIESPTGFTRLAGDYVEQELKSMGYAPVRTNKGGVLSASAGRGILFS